MGHKELIEADIDSAEVVDALSIEAPQPSKEDVLQAYRTYRRLGGQALKEYEHLLAEQEAQEGDDGDAASRAA
jgi:hypothetical protein